MKFGSLQTTANNVSRVRLFRQVQPLFSLLVLECQRAKPKSSHACRPFSNELLLEGTKNAWVVISMKSD